MLFLIFYVVFNSFCTIYEVIESTKLKLALVITTGAPTTLENESTQMPPLVADKRIKVLSNESKAGIYLSNLLLIDSVSRISAMQYSLISLILFYLNFV